MKKPSNAPGPWVFQQPDEAQMYVGLNGRNFEADINNRGIIMIHAKPMPCPNVNDVDSPDHSPSCNKCENGMIYYGHKECKVIFMGNSNSRNFTMQGSMDIDSATFIVPTTYLDGTPLDVQFYDRFMCPLEDFKIRYYQRVEYSQTMKDRLHFPAVAVDKIIDGTIEYKEGIDFKIEEGYIRWISGGNCPGYDINLDKGRVYSINYYTLPVFSVTSLPHQLRTAIEMDKDGNPFYKRYPQLVGVRKDFLPHNSADKVGQSDAPEPRDGGF
jgi:hypothetical protein